jgi:hypothetical protein
LQKGFEILVSLPIGGAGCDGAIFSTNATELAIAVVGAETESGRCVIKFDNFIAFRFRNEMHSLGFLEASFDSVCRIVDSSWVAEMKKIRPAGLWYFETQHFAVMLSNVGYLEVLAEAVQVDTGKDST